MQVMASLPINLYLYNMQNDIDYHLLFPFSIGRTDIPVSDPNPSKRKAISREEYSEGLEKVMMSFGSSRAKKAWSAAKRNHIDSLRLEETLAPAVSHIETEMDKTMSEQGMVYKHIVIKLYLL